jgi:hypothetical protein
MSNGRLRLFLHEKGNGELRGVELSGGAAEALSAYAGAFNYHAAVRGRGVRVRLGEPGRSGSLARHRKRLHRRRSGRARVECRAARTAY